MDVDRIVAVGHALSDPTRVRILQFLVGCCQPVSVQPDGTVRRFDGATVGEVCCHLTGLEQVSSRISFHLKELREAGLVTVERHGKFAICRPNPETLHAMAEALEALANPCCTQEKVS